MAAMGRPPKPTHLKLIEGNPGGRKIGREPKPRQITPDPPDELDADAREEWDRMATSLDRLGLLTEIDRSAFAAYCQAYGRWAGAQRSLKKMAEKDVTGAAAQIIKTQGGNWIQNPLIGIANKAARDMVNFATEFGMTPSARARLAIADAGSDPGDIFGGTLWGSKPSGGKG